MTLAEAFLLLLALPTLLSADVELGDFRHWGREIRDLNYDTYNIRVKRQAQAYDQDLYVTQCGYDNTDPQVLGPNINVQGRKLVNIRATEKAAQLIYLMVRFMPRSIFENLANNSSVGLFPLSQLPSVLFDEFNDMPNPCAGGDHTMECIFCLSHGRGAVTSFAYYRFQQFGKYWEGVYTASCRTDALLPTGEPVDCSVWCTNSEYPNNPSGTTTYPLGFLWAYGDFPRTYVVETNIVCQGYNPGVQGSAKNLLIEEFGLTVLTRGLDAATYRDVEQAYDAAVQNNTWIVVKNIKQYFMLGTLAWFNGADNTDLFGMACLSNTQPNGPIQCNDGYDQRQRLRDLDPHLYNVLNYVYNNNRQYLDGRLSRCVW